VTVADPLAETTARQPAHNVVSLRIPRDLRAAVDQAANARGITVSDLLREALQRLLSTPIGWRCDHLNLTSAPGAVLDVDCPAGCVMRPVFHRSEVELADAA
jgi:hypothetical protein